MLNIVWFVLIWPFCGWGMGCGRRLVGWARSAFAVVGLLSWMLLFGVVPASAATPVGCAELASALGSATAGEVLQLPAGHCQVEATVANTATFTLEGAGGGGTVLEPLGAGKSILQSDEGVRFTLSGLTFTGTSGAPAVLLTGAGEAVTLSGDTFNDDAYPSGYGAGVSIQLSAASTASSPTQLIDDTFSDDHASGGGGVALLGSSPLVVSGSTFTGDSASVGAGGLVVSSRDGGEGAVQITGSTFGGPSVEAGDTSGAVGGGAEIALLPSQSLALTANTFENDRIVGAHSARFEREGAGLFLGLAFEKTGYPVTQAHNMFTDNVIEATQETPSPLLPAGGAGEWISGLSVLSTADSFTGNRVAVNDGEPPEGGALGAFASGAVGATPAQPAIFTGRDDLFSGNSTATGGWGGAVYVGGPLPGCTGSCPGSSLTLEDSTVVANAIDAGASEEGGAIWGSPNDSLALANSIVYGNTQPEIYGFTSTTPTFAYSDLCTEPGAPVITGAGDICADPLLNPDGSETPASPTIDAGSNVLVPAGLTTDIAGNPRILKTRLTCYGELPATVDMGAFEFTRLGPAPPCAPYINPCRCILRRPTVEIADGPLHDRHGAVTVRLTCSRSVAYCDGTVTLTTVQAFASARRGRRHRLRKPLLLGSVHFHIPGGKSARVKIHLSRSALARLLPRTRISVLVRTHARDEVGATATNAHTTGLHLPKARRR